MAANAREKMMRALIAAGPGRACPKARSSKRERERAKLEAQINRRWGEKRAEQLERAKRARKWLGLSDAELSRLEKRIGSFEMLDLLAGIEPRRLPRQAKKTARRKVARKPVDARRDWDAAVKDLRAQGIIVGTA